MLFRASQSLAIIEGAESYFRDKNISMSIKFSNCSQQSEREIIEDIIKLRDGRTDFVSFRQQRQHGYV